MASIIASAAAAADVKDAELMLVLVLVLDVKQFASNTIGEIGKEGGKGFRMFSLAYNIAHVVGAAAITPPISDNLGGVLSPVDSVWLGNSRKTVNSCQLGELVTIGVQTLFLNGTEIVDPVGKKGIYAKSR
tara:strand:+ start:39 stop:431 length:393 start_codon:yes stop_codon:yes gene_type:complete